MWPRPVNYSYKSINVQSIILIHKPQYITKADYSYKYHKQSHIHHSYCSYWHQHCPCLASQARAARSRSPRAHCSLSQAQSQALPWWPRTRAPGWSWPSDFAKTSPHLMAKFIRMTYLMYLIANDPNHQVFYNIFIHFVFS